MLSVPLLEEEENPAHAHTRVGERKKEAEKIQYCVQGGGEREREEEEKKSSTVPLLQWRRELEVLCLVRRQCFHIKVGEEEAAAMEKGEDVGGQQTSGEEDPVSGNHLLVASQKSLIHGSDRQADSSYFCPERKKKTCLKRIPRG